MSQNTLVLPTSGTHSGLEIVNDINSAMDTLLTNSSGSSAPGSPVAFRFWGDSVGNRLKLRNPGNTAWLSVSTDDVVQLGGMKYAVDSGGANHMAITLAPAQTPQDGQHVILRLANTITGDCDLAINAGTAIKVWRPYAYNGGAGIGPCVGGEAIAGQNLHLVLNGAANGGAGAWIIAMPPVKVGKVEWYPGALPPGVLGLSTSGGTASRNTYAALFAYLSTTFGIGDGSTTFGLPFVSGRTIIASGTGAGLTARSVGQTGGEESHTLTAAETAAHPHPTTENPHAHGYSSANTAVGSDATVVTAASTGVRSNTPNTDAVSTGLTVNNNTGAGGSHNNMQPYIVMTAGITA